MNINLNKDIKVQSCQIPREREKTLECFQSFLSLDLTALQLAAPCSCHKGFKFPVQEKRLSILVIGKVRTFPIRISQSIMVKATFLISSQTKPALFVTSRTANELITVATSSILRSISNFGSLVVVFEQHCFVQWNLLTINYYPHIILPSPCCLSSRVLLKSSRSQLIQQLHTIIMQSKVYIIS